MFREGKASRRSVLAVATGAALLGSLLSGVGMHGSVHAQTGDGDPQPVVAEPPIGAPQGGGGYGQGPIGPAVKQTVVPVPVKQVPVKQAPLPVPKVVVQQKIPVAPVVQKGYAVPTYVRPVYVAPVYVAPAVRIALPATGTGGVSDSGTPILPLILGGGALALALGGAFSLRSRRSES